MEVACQDVLTYSFLLHAIMEIRNAGYGIVSSFSLKTKQNSWLLQESICDRTQVCVFSEVFLCFSVRVSCSHSTESLLPDIPQNVWCLCHSHLCFCFKHHFSITLWEHTHSLKLNYVPCTIQVISRKNVFQAKWGRMMPPK